ncbi:MAG: hypothetical protein ACQESX_03300 [Bacteroidota bacterium]
MSIEENREKTKKKIDQLFNELEKLEDQFADASETRKLELKRMMDDIRSRREDLKEKYNNYKEATGESAKEMRRAFDHSVDIFKEHLDNARTYFKNRE